MQCPLTSSVILTAGLLDRCRVTCHRRERSSRTYRACRHCCYSALMTHTILLTIFVHCYVWEDDSACGELLEVWAMATSLGILYYALYRLVLCASVAMTHRFNRCHVVTVSHSHEFVALVHLVASMLTASGFYVFTAFVKWSEVINNKAFVLSFTFCGSLCVIRCCKRCLVHLIHLERCARRAERRVFRERLSNNVLTIAEILEVRRASTADQLREDAASVLAQQPVVDFDKEAFGDHLECCICSSEFDDVVELRKLHCGHYFHSSCLAGWLERSLTCPLCREDLAGNHSNESSVESAQIIGSTQSGIN